MIPKETIEKIFDSADIVEVINDFVSLKKSGSNYKGLSPFINEKSPSFMVSPAKGIFKDFSSGKGGNVVSFVMEHEHFTYPEALRWLAKRYNIEIEEEELTADQIEAQSERESLYLVNQYAKDFYVRQMMNTNEGQAIGLSYFKERGFSEETIKQFELGYSPQGSDHLTKAAESAGYKTDYLIKVGLSKANERGSYDFFRGRVMFPIQNITGRVLGFGGRILKLDKKSAKYYNSPESPIYNKSKILYGLFQAKNEIIKEDKCYLVEGYTDVISLHQAGIKNVVASSGTALTEGQIRLIKRYTKNITILYDGDAAGIKASFRGIDLILEEEMNVKVVLFPNGEDPDSYSRKVNFEELDRYLNTNAQDFIHFKASILLADSKNDPIKKAETIKDIVGSISIIPDQITRSVYIQATSQLFEISEQALLNEVNKRLGVKNVAIQKEQQAYEQKEQQKRIPTKTSNNGKHLLEDQEKDLIRLMILYGAQFITIEVENDAGETEEMNYPVAQFIIEEILSDEISYINKNYQLVFDEYLDGIQQGLVVSEKHFTHHENNNLNQIVIDITTQKDSVSLNWAEKHKIYPVHESSKLKDAVIQSVAIFKMRTTENMIADKQSSLKNEADNDQIIDLLTTIKNLTMARNLFAEKLGIVITR